MSLLSDRDIEAALASGGLIIHPLGTDALQPASVDLRLGACILIAQADGSHRAYDLLENGPYVLGHGDFVLAATLEHVEMPPDLVGILVGKSSRAREGIVVEAAGYVDPGWRGELTLEIDNRSPCPRALCYGMPICQIRLERLTAPPTRLYDGHYQDSQGPVESWRDRAGQGVTTLGRLRTELAP